MKISIEGKRINYWNFILNQIVGSFQFILNITYSVMYPERVEQLLYKNKGLNYPNHLPNLVFNKKNTSYFDYYLYANFPKYLFWQKIKSFSRNVEIIGCVNVLLLSDKKMKKLLYLYGNEENYDSNEWFGLNSRFLGRGNLIDDKNYDINANAKRISKDTFVIFSETSIRYENIVRNISFKRKEFKERPRYIKGLKDERRLQTVMQYGELFEKKVRGEIQKKISNEFLDAQVLYTSYIYNDYIEYYRTRKQANSDDHKKKIEYTTIKRVDEDEDEPKFYSHYALPYRRYIKGSSDYIINCNIENKLFTYFDEDEKNPHSENIINQLKFEKELLIIKEKTAKSIRDIDLVLREFGYTEYNMNELYVQYNNLRNNKLMLLLNVSMIVIAIITLIVAWIE